jgi:catechol 2,3-dioxygenase-like lactoylglutathione lyase family enzyme
MLDHISLRVSDYERSRSFYQAALAPLGYLLAMEIDAGAGFRKGHIPGFWIKQGRPGTDPAADPAKLSGCEGAALHVAFAADDRGAVDAFYRAALAAGGSDNGAPRVCSEYHPNYYGAFVLDPDGYNIEAVCHKGA